MKQKRKLEFKFELKGRRVFSDDFKRKKVQEIKARLTTVAEVCREYEVSSPAVYRWIYLYSDMKKKERLIIESESDTKKIEQLKLKIAELERAIGQKQITIDFLSKMIDIAEESYQIDIKKKYGGAPSSGSGKIEK
jgi:transposase